MHRFTLFLLGTSCDKFSPFYHTATKSFLTALIATLRSQPYLRPYITVWLTQNIVSSRTIPSVYSVCLNSIGKLESPTFWVTDLMVPGSKYGSVTYTHFESWCVCFQVSNAYILSCGMCVFLLSFVVGCVGGLSPIVKIDMKQGVWQSHTNRHTHMQAHTQTHTQPHTNSNTHKTTQPKAFDILLPAPS